VSAAVKGHPWWLTPAAVLGAATLAALGRTWRVAWVRADDTEARGPRREPALFALWHARLLGLTWTHRGLGAGVLISQHRDGEIIARVAQRLGFRTPRGSSTRGGEGGALEMLSLAAAGHLLGVTPDGPRGPAERAKDGVVWLASRSGLPVVPVAASARPEWRLRSWDGFRVPKPFARVWVGYGPEIHVPPALDEAGVAHWRDVIETALVEVTRRMDARAEARA
jgi:lysophospholipid acyltransferase (LPLAT)-like uncharacterized protein